MMPRIGSNAGDRVLTAANVRGLRERWRVRLDAVADLTPIVVGTMLFQTTNNGTTNAIDASTGHVVLRENELELRDDLDVRRHRIVRGAERDGASQR